MEEQQQQQQQQPPQQPANVHIKLPPLWSNNILSWFAMAEGHFALRGINDELVRYYNVLTALPESVVNCIADFVEAPLPADPYTQLRIRLLAAHQLSDYQKVEAIKKMPALGAQKPSELLNEMLRICPRGMEANIFFIHEFISLLPRDIRAGVAGLDFADRRALAERADELYTHTARQSHEINAVLQEEEAAAIAAVRGQPARARRPPPAKRNFAAGKLSAADEQALKDSGLCYYHFAYADGARKCKKPCAWAEN
jgi:hypothetical protein